jgi:hypothetical protein
MVTEPSSVRVQPPCAASASPTNTATPFPRKASLRFGSDVAFLRPDWAVLVAKAA